MKKLILIYCFLSCVVSFNLQAQQVKIESNLDKDSIQLGQTITVRYSYPSTIRSFLNIQSTSDFKLLDSNYTVNENEGRRVCEVRFNAKHTGTLKLPIASLVHEGHTFKSEMLTVMVQAKSNSPAVKQDQSTDNFFDDVPASSSTSGTTKNSDTVEYNGSQLFAQLEPDHTSAYIGEQLTLRGFLYSLRPLDIKGMKAPKLDGFWVWEDSTADGMLDHEIVTYKGSKYYKYALFRNVLFPLAPGDIRIPPIPLTCYADIELEGGDQSADASIAKMFKLKALVKRQVKLNSNAVKLHVKNLPQDTIGEQVDLVGDYNLRNGQADIHDFGNGTYEVTYTIAGKGNLKFVQAPVMPQNQDWDISEPNVIDSFSLKEGVLYGVRKISYTMSSTKEGTNYIPAFSIRYFNPQSTQYLTLKVDRKELKSIQHADNVNQVETLNGIHEATTIVRNESRSVFSEPTYWAAYLLPLALLLGSVGYKKYQSKRDVRRKYYEAKTNALKSIELGQAMLKENKIEEYYNQVYSTLWTYIKDKFMIHQTNMNEEFVLKLLTEKQVSSTDLNRFVAMNHACQARLYGSNLSDTVSNELSIQLKELIVNLDNHCDEIQKK